MTNPILRLFILLLMIASRFVNAEPAYNPSQMEIVRNQLPHHHTYQNSFGRLGLAGLIYCGPAAVTESLAFLKWTRSPSFPLLKWAGNDPNTRSDSDDYMYRQTLDLVELFKTDPWQIPFFNPLYTDSVEIVKGLRSYFKDSGYPQPWVFARGYRAFDAPPGKSLGDMGKPVTLSEIREYTKKGYGVVILIGYYNRLGKTKRRNGGHYLSVFGYEYDSAWGEDRTDFIVTDSLLTSKKQPRRISVSLISKNPNRNYPNHVKYKVDDDDTVYLDAAIFFIPQAQE